MVKVFHLNSRLHGYFFLLIFPLRYIIPFVEEKKLKFLIVGDVVGRPGLDRLKLELNNRKNDVDFIIVNGENSASGRGLRTKEYE